MRFHIIKRWLTTWLLVGMSGGELGLCTIVIPDLIWNTVVYWFLGYARKPCLIQRARKLKILSHVFVRDRRKQNFANEYQNLAIARKKLSSWTYLLLGSTSYLYLRMKFPGQTSFWFTMLGYYTISRHSNTTVGTLPWSMTTTSGKAPRISRSAMVRSPTGKFAPPTESATVRYWNARKTTE